MKGQSLGSTTNQVELSQSLETRVQSTTVQQLGALFTQDPYQQILQLLSRFGVETVVAPPARATSMDVGIPLSALVIY